jgi:hypothetical protein
VGLPETIRVKISSEAAEYVSLTPVVVRDMPVIELIGAMLGVTGKDAGRIRDLLFRGVFVAGASRLRWQGWEADPAAIESLLSAFPDADPARPFARQSCVRAVLKGPSAPIHIPREVGSGRRLFRRRSFWDALMDLAEAGAPRYLGYSYRERADLYAVQVSPAAAELLRESAAAIRYSTIEAQVCRASLESIEFHVERATVGNP